ncbi:uncharacterized protein J3R85_013947 [Psidium guajava]|nr:uncharacterized protein J3R85_013947 [Psidium guajava]
MPIYLVKLSRRNSTTQKSQRIIKSQSRAQTKTCKIIS